MFDLVRSNHIYIAQPPLYKVKRGKVERYIANDNQLRAFYLESALINLELFVDKEKIESQQLKDLGSQYLEFENCKMILEAKYPPFLLDALVDTNFLIEDYTKDSMEKLLKHLIVKFDDINSLIIKEYRLKEEGDLECRLEMSYEQKGVGGKIVLSSNFFLSDDFDKYRKLSAKLFTDCPVQVAFKHDQSKDFSNVGSALEYYVNNSKKVSTLQRYKGLGEMNPEQLWETTMNPQTRNLLQVDIKDEEKATVIFSTLMGDQVEPRRDFIQQNALNTSNVDI